MYGYWSPHGRAVRQLPSGHGGCAMTDADGAADLVTEFLDAVWNRGTVDPAAVTNDYVVHLTASDEPATLADERGAAATWHESIPDFELEIHDVIATATRVAVRYRYTGTHEGDLLGYPPTGAPIETDGIAICRLEGDRIAETWYVDHLHALHTQLRAATDERRDALVRTYLETVYGTGSADASLVSDDFRAYIGHTDDGWTFPERQAVLEIYHEAFPDLSVDVQETIVAGETVVARIRLTGTHTGRAFNVDGRLDRTVEPAGATVDVVSAGIFRVADGRITEVQWFSDKLALLDQLDAAPE